MNGLKCHNFCIFTKTEQLLQKLLQGYIHIYSSVVFNDIMFVLYKNLAINSKVIAGIFTVTCKYGLQWHKCCILMKIKHLIKKLL
jgi:hypothetical protein